MRITAIEIDGFRGWASSQRLELDADVVLIEGPNGSGKTSMFDAVLWAITGEIPRLGDEHKHEVVSIYGDTGVARVRLDLRDQAGATFQVTRSTAGERSRLMVETMHRTVRDEAASLLLMRALWPEGAADADGTGLASAMARAVYLQQDDVRRFVEADSDAQRFGAVAELVGVGRYTDVQHQLERERQAWTRQTNERKAALAKEAGRVSQLQAQVAEIPDSLEEMTGWREWRGEMQRELSDEAGLPADPEEPGAPEAVDTAVRRLSDVIRQRRRRFDQLTALVEEIESARAVQVATPEALMELRVKVENLDQEVDRLRSELAMAEQHAAAERDRQRQARTQQQELQTIATLALRHLGVRCPVCDQTYDLAATRERLSAIAAPVAHDAPISTAEAVTELSGSLASAEARQSQLRFEYGEADRRAADRQAALSSGYSRLRELGVKDEDVDRMLTREREELTRLQALAHDGEAMALRLARASERSRRDELERSLEAARAELASLTADMEGREETGALASRVIDGLREASEDLVARRLESLGSTLDRFFARIDPHPSLRTVALVTRTWHGRGRLQARLSDDSADVHSDVPQVVLSSSQLNALALAVFLTLNLGATNLPLSTVLLDDPLQSLDEVNLLGVVDLLRRFKAHRQLFISTHDRRFAALLQRKLRAVAPGETISIVKLSDWRRSGPTIQQAFGTTDSTPWMIAKQA